MPTFHFDDDVCGLKPNMECGTANNHQYVCMKKEKLKLGRGNYFCVENNHNKPIVITLMSIIFNPLITTTKNNFAFFFAFFSLFSLKFRQFNFALR